MKRDEIKELRTEAQTSEMDNRISDDDNWGYIVCFGTIITFIGGIGHVNSFGLIYNEFMKETNSTTKSLTTAHGVFAVMLAIGGIILNITTKKCSLRLGGIVGSILFIIGSFSTIFITNTSQLSLTFGILQGIGFGIMVPVSYATINYYYVKRRTMVMSICKGIQGVFQMAYPQFLKLIMYEYGFKGTLLILSGISLHTMAGMMTMVKRNDVMKPNAKTAEENVSNGEIVELMGKRDEEQAIAAPDNENIKTVPKGLWSIILELIKVDALKDIVYCNICIGQSFVNFSDLTFFILQPMLLFQLNYDTNQVATCISIVAGADVAGRFVLAALTMFISVNTRLLFYISTLLTFVFRIALLQVRQYVYVSILTTILGVLRAWLHVASPLVIANHVSHQDFPGAYALFMLATGIVNVFFGPVIGLLKDIYEDFVPAFYALTACCIPCLLLWPIEYKLIKKNN